MKKNVEAFNSPETRNLTEYEEFTKIKLKINRNDPFYKISRYVMTNYIKPFLAPRIKVTERNPCVGHSSFDCKNYVVCCFCRMMSHHCLLSGDYKKQPIFIFPDVSKLKGVHAIRIDNQSISRIPTDLPNSLTFLCLAGNRIKEIPKKLPDSLTHLVLDGNQIKKIPNELPNSLKWLYLEGNQIEEIPNKLPNYLTCFLSGNQIREIPTTFPNSLFLDLQRNPLSNQTKYQISHFQRYNIVQ